MAPDPTLLALGAIGTDPHPTQEELLRAARRRLCEQLAAEVEVLAVEHADRGVVADVQAFMEQLAAPTPEPPGAPETATRR